MAKYKSIKPAQLIQHARDYLKECINALKQVKTTAGVKEIKERQIPTIGYFLYIWLPLKNGEAYCRRQWYNIVHDKTHPYYDTIKLIDEMFTALAIDIIANEDKGLFYARNRLGMADRPEQKTADSSISTLSIQVVTSGLPPATSESEVTL